MIKSNNHINYELFAQLNPIEHGILSPNKKLPTHHLQYVVASSFSKHKALQQESRIEEVTP